MHATVLFGHGSRDPLWRQPIDTIAQRMREMQPQGIVNCAFLELTTPDLPSVMAELVANGTQRVTIVPMFLGVGRHAREDLPLLVKDLQAIYPALDIELRPSVGEDPRVINMLAQLSLAAD